MEQLLILPDYVPARVLPFAGPAIADVWAQREREGQLRLLRRARVVAGRVEPALGLTPGDETLAEALAEALFAELTASARSPGGTSRADPTDGADPMEPAE
jgi:hypothetical protein